MSTTNPCCRALGIEVPRLEAARDRADANFYSLLLVALLERGEPLTLEDVANRFEEEGIAPARNPAVVVLLDVGRRDISTFAGEALARARERLADYDVIAGVDVRVLLRNLRFEPGERRLGELGPPQKSKSLNRRGRTLQITTSLLVKGSCGISRPFGAEKTLRGYLQAGSATRLRRRLEADAKSLFALYQYGRLHGAVRLRWGFLDEMIPAPWVHRDERTLRSLMSRAAELGAPLDVVVGSAPGWADPWSRARRARVATAPNAWQSWLVDEHGFLIDAADVQLARIAGRRSSSRSRGAHSPRFSSSSSRRSATIERSSSGARTGWSGSQSDRRLPA